MPIASNGRRPVANAAFCLAFSALFLIVQGSLSRVLAQGPQQFIVTFQEGTTLAGRATTVGNAGAALRFDHGFVNATAVTIPNPNALAALESDPSVLSVVPDRPVFALQRANKKPDNPGNGGNGGNGGGSDQVTPSGVTQVGLPTSSSDGFAIGVAVLDTGIDLLNPDLVLGGNYNAFGGLGQDDNGHGTHVAGTVAAVDNNIGVVGVAPRATLYAVKVLDSTGSGTDSSVIDGLNWVWNNWSNVDPQIRVVNMSLGRPGSLNDQPALRAAIQLLDDVGIAVIVAAGNDPFSTVSQQVPAVYPETIAVASSTAQAGANQCRRFSGFVEEDTASYWTTDGVGVDISAPGESHENINKGCRLVSVGILSTKLGGGTERKYGTSMATPHVSGVVARMFQNGFICSVGSSCAADVRSELESTARGVGADADPPPPLPHWSPSAAYEFDGEYEGVAVAP